MQSFRQYASLVFIVVVDDFPDVVVVLVVAGFLFRSRHLAVDDKNSSGVRSQPWHQLVDDPRCFPSLQEETAGSVGCRAFPLTLRVLSCSSCGSHSHSETLAGVCIWICVLCGASVCVSHCRCGCVCFYISMYVCVNVGSIAVAAVVGKCRCRSMLPSVLKTRKCVCKQQHLWLQQDLQSNLHSFHALSGLIDFS